MTVGSERPCESHRLVLGESHLVLLGENVVE